MIRKEGATIAFGWSEAVVHRVACLHCLLGGAVSHVILLCESDNASQEI